MSRFDLTAAGVVLVEAERITNALDQHWVQLTVFAQDNSTFEINWFFRGPVADEAAAIYAEAIRDAAEKVRALEVPLLTPTQIANRCLAIVEDKS